MLFMISLTRYKLLKFKGDDVMGKRSRITRVLLLAIAILLMFNFMSFIVMAETPSETAASINKLPVEINTTTWFSIGGMILTFVRLIGVVLGIILMVFFGIQWMISNQNKRAELKEKMWNYVIGAGFLFGAGPIAQLFYDVVTKNINK